jgi:hypothetical protein
VRRGGPAVRRRWESGAPSQVERRSSATAWERSGGSARAGAPVSAGLRLATSSYHAPDRILASGLTPVGITVSPPRWPLRYRLAGNVGALAPHGLLAISDRDEYAARYLEQLDRLDPERIARLLTSFAVQVQRWLGHHKSSFTLDTYVHMLDEDVPEPTFFDALATACDHPATTEARNGPKPNTASELENLPISRENVS